MLHYLPSIIIFLAIGCSDGIKTFEEKPLKSIPKRTKNKLSFINDSAKPKVTISLESIRARYQEIAQKVEANPFYDATRIDENAPLKIALLEGHLAALKEITRQAISVISQKIPEIGYPLVYSIEKDKKAVFDLLLSKYHRLHLYDQHQELSLKEALKLCKTNTRACSYYLKKMLDKGFSPASIINDPMLKLPELKDIDDRINAIAQKQSIAPPSDRGALISLIDSCDIDGIEQFLSDKNALVDWTNEFPITYPDGAKKTFQMTALCYLSHAELKNTCDRLNIFKILLKHGANANCLSEENPFFNIFFTDTSKKWSDTTKYWQMAKSHGANPYLTHPGYRASLSEAQAENKKLFPPWLKEYEHYFPNLFNEQFFRKYIATVVGVEYQSNLYRTPMRIIGESTHIQVLELIDDFFEDFIESPLPDYFSDEKLLVLDHKATDKLKKSLQFGTDIMFTKASNNRSLVRQILLNSKDFPVILPVGWYGHAVSIVIYKDLLIKLNKGEKSDGVISGARFYEFFPSEETIFELLPLITQYRTTKLSAEEGKKLFDFEIDQKMGLTELPSIEENQQCIGNCGWESFASFGFQLALAILLTENYSEKTASELVADLNYEKARSITENFKRFAQYDIIKKYIHHAITTLGNNKCLPETNILTAVLAHEIDKAISPFIARKDSHNYFGLKIIDEILTSGLPLAGFAQSFSPYSLRNSKRLSYILQRIGAVPEGFLLSKPASQKDLELVQIAYDIYKPSSAGKIYPWGKCFY